jgi:anaerobic selenocysteine-containing dehydrogenase
MSLPQTNRRREEFEIGPIVLNTRRDRLALTAARDRGRLAVHCSVGLLMPVAPAADRRTDDRTVRTSCRHLLRRPVPCRDDCDGRIVSRTDTGGRRACAAVAGLRGTRVSPPTIPSDRLLHPLRRLGPRSAFERISWDAALDLIAAELQRQATYGNSVVV